MQPQSLFNFRGSLTRNARAIGQHKSEHQSSFHGLSIQAGRIAQWSCLLFILLIVPYLSAQNTGSIFGQVTDSSGHPIPGAEITVTSVGESLTRNAQANDSGEYTLPALPVGTYRVTVTAPSF